MKAIRDEISRDMVMTCLLESRIEDLIYCISDEPETARPILEKCLEYMQASGKRSASYEETLPDYLVWDDLTYGEVLERAIFEEHTEYKWYSILCRCVEKKLESKLKMTLDKMKRLGIPPCGKLMFLYYHFPLDPTLVEKCKEYGFTDSRYEKALLHSPHTNKYRGWRYVMHCLYHDYDPEGMMTALNESGPCALEAFDEFFNYDTSEQKAYIESKDVPQELKDKTISLLLYKERE